MNATGQLPLTYAFIAVGLLLASGDSGCKDRDQREMPRPGQEPARVQAWSTPRYSLNRRAIYAPRELDSLASDLLGQLERARSDRLPRVAFYYFTRDGRKDFLGESIAQDLESFLVRRSEGRVDLYTRRKLETIARELRMQLTELFDQATLVRLGKRAGVDTIVTGRLVVEKDSVLINSQILDVETAGILGGQNVRIGLDDVKMQDPVLALETASRYAAQEIWDALSASETWRLAIYDLTRSKEEFPQGKEMAEAIATDLATLDRHVMPLTRSAIWQAIEELKIQRSELYDEETRARIAKFAGGNVVLTGFAEVFRDFYLSTCKSST